MRDPHSAWPPPPPTADKRAAENSRDRLRRLPLLRRTASWQAAYNSACLYAALASESLAGQDGQAREACEGRVIVSLERVVNNPHSEMGRPYDLISQDPDFSALRLAPAKFPRFKKFLDDQRRMDYPDFDADAAGTQASHIQLA